MLARIFRLFVDDARFTIAILVWLIAVAALAHAPITEAAKGPILFAGLAGILVENTVRRARRQKT